MSRLREPFKLKRRLEVKVSRPLGFQSGNGDSLLVGLERSASLGHYGIRRSCQHPSIITKIFVTWLFAMVSILSFLSCVFVSKSTWLWS